MYKKNFSLLFDILNCRSDKISIFVHTHKQIIQIIYLAITFYYSPNEKSAFYPLSAKAFKFFFTTIKYIQIDSGVNSI